MGAKHGRISLAVVLLHVIIVSRVIVLSELIPTNVDMETLRILYVYHYRSKSSFSAIS